MKHIIKHISAYRSRRRSITSTLNHYQVLLCTDAVRQEWVSCTTHSIEESPSNRCCRYKGEKDDLSVGRIPQYQLSIGDIMKQLIKQALGVQPRKMPLQTRSVQLRIKYKTTTVAKKQSKLWAFAQNASALVTLGQLLKDLLVSLLANL